MSSALSFVLSLFPSLSLPNNHRNRTRIIASLSPPSIIPSFSCTWTITGLFHKIVYLYPGIIPLLSYYCTWTITGTVPQDYLPLSWHHSLLIILLHLDRYRDSATRLSTAVLASFPYYHTPAPGVLQGQCHKINSLFIFLFNPPHSCPWVLI